MTTLNFKGRVFVENHHLAVPYHELKPMRAKGLSERASLHDNLILHGDNLAALKALLPTYHRKVKCIFIDPPYNTGNEGWAYNDRVNSPMMQDWLGKVVDRDDLTRHDKWCCMMLPRLKLLRELLTDDGAIFITIDDNEVHRLRCLMDDVFGEDNFVANVVWHHRKSKQNDIGVSLGHNHILWYARDQRHFEFRALPVDESDFSNPDNDQRGPWAMDPMDAPNVRANLSYEIVNPNTGETHNPPAGRCWRFSEAKYNEALQAGRIVFGRTGRAKPYYKRFLHEAREKGRSVGTIWQDIGTATSATKELNHIFGRKSIFATPKPSDLVRKIILLSTDKDSIVLDSFAGSGATAHAVLALNKEDGGNRRFVLIECEDYADSITAERVRRVIRGVPAAKDPDLKAGLGGTFSYFELGEAMRRETILDGSSLPAYDKLAGYVFFTATGEEFDPTKVDQSTWFIGSSRLHDVFLMYVDDIQKLKDLALTTSVAKKLPTGKRQRLVFAPTKYMDPEFLHHYRITFQQLPFEIYEAAETLMK